MHLDLSNATSHNRNILNSSFEFFLLRTSVLQTLSKEGNVITVLYVIVVVCIRDSESRDLLFLHFS